MTTMLAMTALLVGVLLSMRFKVLILAPATLIGAVVTFGAVISHRDSVWSIVLASVLAIVALQIGYFAGSVVMAEARIGKNSAKTVELAE
jgi:hypothetical protein